MHKNSGCSIITLIFLSKIFECFSAVLIDVLIAFIALSRLIITPLCIPFDSIIDVDKISEVLSSLILKIKHLIFILPNSTIPIGSLIDIILLLSYHAILNQ